MNKATEVPKLNPAIQAIKRQNQYWIDPQVKHHRRAVLRLIDVLRRWLLKWSQTFGTGGLDFADREFCFRFLTQFVFVL